MKFVIEKNKDIVSENFILVAKPESIKEKEWFYSKKMRNIKQHSKPGYAYTYVSFAGKMVDSLEEIPYESVLKKRKTHYEALWHTILLFKKRF